MHTVHVFCVFVSMNARPLLPLVSLSPGWVRYALHLSSDPDPPASYLANAWLTVAVQRASLHMLRYQPLGM